MAAGNLRTIVKGYITFASFDCSRQSCFTASNPEELDINYIAATNFELGILPDCHNCYSLNFIVDQSCYKSTMVEVARRPSFAINNLVHYKIEFMVGCNSITTSVQELKIRCLELIILGKMQGPYLRSFGNSKFGKVL